MKRHPGTARRRHPAAREATWRCAGRGTLSAALARLGPAGAVLWGAQRTETLRFHDTYDGDLAGAGLSVLQHGKRLLLCPAGRWHARHALVPPVRMPAGVTPVTPGPVTAAISRRIGQRRLLPIGEVRRHVAPGELQDAAGRPVARLHLEEYRQARTRGRPLLVLVHVGPLRRGCPLVSALGRALARQGLERLSGTDLLGLLPVLLPMPDRQTVRPRSQARAREPAGAAVPALALALLAALRRQEQGLLEDIDTECLHQYRVHLRRLRTLLSQMWRALPEEATTVLRDQLAALARRTNRLRDLDVMLAAGPAYRDALPPDLQSALDPTLLAARRRRGLERGRVLRFLRSAAYAELMEHAQRTLEAAPGQPAGGQAGTAVHRLVCKRLRRLCRRLVRRIRALPDAASAADYHRLRVQCKRLRYLLDLFRGVLARRSSGLLEARLQALQDVLGALNDLAVQRAQLGGLAQAGAEEGLPAAGRTGTLAGLWRRLDRRQAALERRARTLLHRFCGRRIARALSRL